MLLCECNASTSVNSVHEEIKRLKTHIFTSKRKKDLIIYSFFLDAARSISYLAVFFQRNIHTIWCPQSTDPHTVRVQYGTIKYY